MLSDLVDEQHSLQDVARLVRRAGMEHAFVVATSNELEALADAGDWLTLRNCAAMVQCLAEPEEALRPFDGGAAARAKVKTLARQMSRMPSGGTE